MSEHPLVDEYLARLHRELRLPRRRRADVLAEAHDHLLCAVAALTRDGRSDGDGAREAVARYGSAQVVAQSHARARSGRATARLAGGVAASIASFVALFAATTQVPAVQAGIPATAMTSGAAGVVGWIAVQLAVACGALTLIRCWRLRVLPAPRAGTLRLVNRSAATAVGAIGLSLVFDLAAFVRMPAGQGQHAELVFGLWSLTMAAITGAAVQVLVAHRRLRWLERYGAEAAREDALDDIRETALAVLRLVAAAPIVGAPARVAERVVAGALAGRSPLARALRGRPWRFGAGCAVLVGLLAGGAHLVAEGFPADGVGVALLVVLIITAIEGAAVLACYALLGRFLGIRDHGRSRRRELA
jgi:hypothetical protein